MALYGDTAEKAVHDYVDGVIRRHVFAGKEKQLRAWETMMMKSAAHARSLADVRQGRPLSGIQLNSANDLYGDDAHMKKRRAYAKGLERAGVSSVFFPPADSRTLIDTRLGSIDHLFLVGGADIHPARYKQQVTHAALDEVNDKRDSYEQTMIRHALKTQLPIDGTCRGFQMLNVATGGTLVQDIHDDGLSIRAHAATGMKPIRHSIRVVPGSAIAGVIGTRVRAVPSVHHEAVGNVGKGFTVVARSPDNVPEAIEGFGGRVRGYQFHAEMAPRAKFSKAIFGSIAARASAYKGRN